jgi:hypothetical protein
MYHIIATDPTETLSGKHLTYEELEMQRKEGIFPRSDKMPVAHVEPELPSLLPVQGSLLQISGCPSLAALLYW